MSTASVKEIQYALKQEGFDPGPLDGIWGRKTISAIEAFQKYNHLSVDGIFGPQTAQTLYAGLFKSISALPLPWSSEALRLVGTQELLGERNNLLILDWSKDLDLDYTEDATPWCGLFLAHCISSTLPKEILPDNPLGARRWLTFGMPTTPRTGAIMVFWRGSEESHEGHVGLYLGEDNESYRILGGNQDDAVCIIWISRKRFLEARWPLTASALMNTAEILNFDKKEDIEKH